MKWTYTIAGLVAAIGMTGLALAQTPAAPEVAPAPTPVAPSEPHQPVPPTPPMLERPAAEPAPPVVHHKWVDGEFYAKGSEWILRQRRSNPGTTNIITNSGNGWGNRIVVDSGVPSGSVTVIQNSRNGVGNRIVVDGIELRIDGPTIPTWVFGTARPVPEAHRGEQIYQNRGNPFWTEKLWSDTYQCYLYWCPRTERWFRYHPRDDQFRPIPSAAGKHATLVPKAPNSLPMPATDAGPAGNPPVELPVSPEK